MNHAGGVMRVNGIEIDDDRLARVERLFEPAAGAPSLAAAAAVRELLRQRAQAVGLLDEHVGTAAAEDLAIERLLERDVRIPEPSMEECRRIYERHPDAFDVGAVVRGRHILFQVYPGAPVAAIRAKAEEILVLLKRQPQRVAEFARTHSNCPSAAQGGDFGAMTRESCAPELRAALFTGSGLGLIPQLVHSRHGFHIFVIEQRQVATRLRFEQVAASIARHLRTTVERKALAQYVRVLAGDAALEGVDLGGAPTPLVQ